MMLSTTNPQLLPLLRRKQQQWFLSLMFLFLLTGNNNSNKIMMGVSAFRNFALSCSAGTDALLQPNQIIDLQTHGIANQVGTGPIGDYGLVMHLDGMPLSLSTSTTGDNNFTYGEDHILTLVFEKDDDDDANSEVSPASEPPKFFTGFLIRMEATDGTTETWGALFNDDDSDDDDSVQLVDSCESETPSVAGVSHTNNEGKQQTNVTLNLDVTEPISLILDVTVVIEMSVMRNISHWYYSRYTLNAIKPENQPTTSPTTSPEPTPTPQQPTDKPTTQMPVEATPEPTGDDNNGSSSAHSLIGGGGISFCGTSTMILLLLLACSVTVPW